MDTYKRAGKAIGGGKLTQIGRDGTCIGTIVETLGLWIVTVRGREMEVHHSLHQALTAAARLTIDA